MTWAEVHADVDHETTLVVADTTSISAASAVERLRDVFPQARIAVCSLHRNEVEVFDVSHEGVVTPMALPSLLSIAG